MKYDKLAARRPVLSVPSVTTPTSRAKPKRLVDVAAQSSYAKTVATADLMTGERDETAQTLRRIAERVRSGLTELAAPLHAADAARAVSRPQPTLHQTPEHRRVAQLAHELKTPLSAIVAAAEIMRDERLGPIGDDRYRGYAGDIFESAMHALSVISVMLSSATLIAASAAPRTRVQLDLNETVERITSSVRALVEAAGLTIEHELSLGVPAIVADATSVRQMLLNLVTNAIRATPAGGRIVMTTAHLGAGPVTVSVSDNGSGMSALEIAAVLHPDSRNSDATNEVQTKASGGLGLGYGIVQELALANGATVSIESDPKIGTTVTITFLTADGSTPGNMTNELGL